MYDIQQFHKTFYEIKRQDVQDSFIWKHFEAHPTKRHKYEPLQKPKKVRVKYFVYSVSNTRRVPVCREAFLGILAISKHRVLNIASNYKKTGQSPKNKRGGDYTSHKKWAID